MTSVSAGSLTVSGNCNLNGNVNMGDAASDAVIIAGTIQGTNALAFEGTPGGGRTLFAFGSSSSDNTISFPSSPVLAVVVTSSDGKISGSELNSNTIDGSKLTTNISISSTGNIQTTGSGHISAAGISLPFDR